MLDTESQIPPLPQEIAITQITVLAFADATRIWPKILKALVPKVRET